jgi:hypothetical protein
MGKKESPPLFPNACRIFRGNDLLTKKFSGIKSNPEDGHTLMDVLKNILTKKASLIPARE